MKRGRGYLLLVLGVIVGALFSVWGEIYSVNAAKMEECEEILQDLDANRSMLAVGISEISEQVQQDIYIEWYFNEEDGKYYFFLPSSWCNNFNAFWIVNGIENAHVEEQEVLSGETFSLEEGEYSVSVDGKTYQMVVMYSSNISAMFLNTQSGSLDYIHEDTFNMEPGKYILFDERGQLNNYGKIDELECRGNVSYKFADKKSYRIKMADKEYILDMGEDRDWALIANPFDVTLSRNMIVNNMAKRLSMDYVPDMKYMDVYANGQYIGNYVFSEKIECSRERVNINNLSEDTEQLNQGIDLYEYNQVIEKPGKLFSRKWWEIPNEPQDNSGGYLMELEMSDRYGLEASGFMTSRMQSVVVHEPKYATLGQITYIADMYQDFEDALFDENGFNEKTGKYFYEYIDMDSFTTKYMLEELVKNMDASSTSCFIYKPEYDTKIHAGPVWDYDASINFDREASNGVYLKDPKGLYVATKKRDSDIWWALYQQPYFRQYVDWIFDNGFKDNVIAFIDTFIDDNADMILNSSMMNAVRWGQTEDEGYEATVDNYYMRMEELETFLLQRLNWLEMEWDYN